MDEIPTKPYVLRALFDWCVDNGYTPHLAVKVDARTQVPQEYAKNGEITLNLAPTAVHKLQMGNDLIEFSARFGGVARQISVPVQNVFAIYARETGHGMTFEIEPPKSPQPANAGLDAGLKPGTVYPLPVPAGNPEPRGPTNSPNPPNPPNPSNPSKGGGPHPGGKPTLRRVK